METFSFRLVTSDELPRRTSELSTDAFAALLCDATLEQGALVEDFRIRRKELAAHLRKLGKLTGLGRELERLVLEGPPPGQTASVEGFGYVPLELVQRLLETLQSLSEDGQSIIAEDDDLDATYGVLLSSFEEAKRRSMAVAIVES